MALEYKAVPFETKEVQENGIFKGYGSTFGGKPDSYGDIIAPGAFSDSITKNGRGGMGIALLYQHDSTKIPGVITGIAQDAKGLPLDGLLAMKTQLGAETYELLKLKALKGMSIGFDLPREKSGKVSIDAYELDEKNNTRLLKKINLWEVSLVTFPANTRARVTGVKGFQEAKTVRELERILRDSGMPKADAVYLASMCKTGLRDSGGSNEVQGLLETVRKTNTEMKQYSLLAGLLNDLNLINSDLKT